MTECVCVCVFVAFADTSMFLESTSTHRRRGFCKVQVCIEQDGDVVLAGLQGNGQRCAAILQEKHPTERC